MFSRNVDEHGRYECTGLLCRRSLSISISNLDSASTTVGGSIFGVSHVEHYFHDCI